MAEEENLDAPSAAEVVEPTPEETPAEEATPSPAVE